MVFGQDSHLALDRPRMGLVPRHLHRTELELQLGAVNKDAESARLQKHHPGWNPIFGSKCWIPKRAAHKQFFFSPCVIFCAFSEPVQCAQICPSMLIETLARYLLWRRPWLDNLMGFDVY